MKCKDCPNEAQIDRKRCVSCLKKCAARQRKVAELRRQRGLCNVCGSVAVVGKTRCKICNDKELAKLKVKNRKYRILGLCQCGAKARPGRSKCEKCTDSNQLRQSTIRKTKKASGICYDCSARSVRNQLRCEKCAAAHSAKVEKAHLVLKLRAFEAYGGPICACCAESIIMLLTIDHMSNDGNKHRKDKSVIKIYRWLKNNNYPPGFQVLCWSCNMGKHLNGGVCPHQNQALDQ